MGVIERVGHRRDHRDHVAGRKSARMRVQQIRRVGAVDVLHRDPQLTVGLTAVEDADDVGMIEGGCDVGLTGEPLAEHRIAGESRWQDLERVLAGEARVIGEIDLAHPAGTELADDAVTGEALAG